MGMIADRARFNSIVKGKVRQNLRRYLTRTDLFGRKGGQTIKVPVPEITLPRFRFAQDGGVSHGDGGIGSSPFPDDPDEQDPDIDQEWGEHILEAEVSIDELAEMLGEELGLPEIEPRGEDKIISEKYKVRGISRVGPETLRHFRRGHLQALKRVVSSGKYDLRNPVVVPTKEDMRYKALERVPTPVSNAVIIYMMDVSGSMGDEQKRLVRNTCFWISTWLQKHYQGVKERYIIHDSKAVETDRETFFHTSQSGATLFAPAYNLCLEMIAREYDPQAYNIYPFHFSDGDNYGGEDTRQALEILTDHLLPAVNMFGYGQCFVSGQPEGKFLEIVERHFKLDEVSEKISSKVRTGKLYNDEQVANVLRHFLRTGR